MIKYEKSYEKMADDIEVELLTEPESEGDMRKFILKMKLYNISQQKLKFSNLLIIKDTYRIISLRKTKNPEVQ